MDPAEYRSKRQRIGSVVRNGGSDLSDVCTVSGRPTWLIQARAQTGFQNSEQVLAIATRGTRDTQLFPVSVFFSPSHFLHNMNMTDT